MVAQRKFSNIIDLQKGVEQYCRLALQDTLDELKDILHDCIVKDIYNTKKGTFYQRTRILLIKDIIMTKIWNAFSANRLGGTLSFDENLFERSIDIDRFQHGAPLKKGKDGNIYGGELTLQSYLEIVNSRNDWDNPYQFPVVNRGLFWDDFMSKIEERGGFGAIYKENFDKYVYTTYKQGTKYYHPRK